MVIKKGVILWMCIIALSGCGAQVNQKMAFEKEQLLIANLDTKEVFAFNYLLFETKEQKMKGLSGTDPLSDNEVALFVLDKGDSAFWMKDMNYPLDILFFNNDNLLISLIKNIEPCTQNQRCTQHNIPKGAKWALEAKAGLIQGKAIEPGSVLSL